MLYAVAPQQVVRVSLPGVRGLTQPTIQLYTKTSSDTRGTAGARRLGEKDP